MSNRLRRIGLRSSVLLSAAPTCSRRASAAALFCVVCASFILILNGVDSWPAVSKHGGGPSRFSSSLESTLQTPTDPTPALTTRSNPADTTAGLRAANGGHGALAPYTTLTGGELIDGGRKLNRLDVPDEPRLQVSGGVASNATAEVTADDVIGAGNSSELLREPETTDATPSLHGEPFSPGVTGDEFNATTACPPSAAASTAVFMSRWLTPRIILSARLLQRQCVDAHVMLDAPVPDTIDATLRPWVHYLPDSEPRDAGFQLTTGRFVRPVTAWDRTLLWAYKRRDRFKFQWLIEDDVAWEPRGALAGLIKRYDRDSEADLITRWHQGTREQSPRWTNWRRPLLSLDPTKLMTSFNPICRISSRLLDTVGALGHKHGRLAYHEFLFASLARMHGLRIHFFDTEYDGTYIRYRPMYEDPELQQLAGMAAAHTTSDDDAANEGGIVVHPVKFWPHALHPRALRRAPAPPGNASA